MIKLTKSNKVLRLIVCTLTALFVSLSFMGCPSPYGTDLPDTDTEQTGTETGADAGSTTTPTTVDPSDYKDFYVQVTGANPDAELNMTAETKNLSDTFKRNTANSGSYQGFDTIEEVKTYILTWHVEHINWATESEIESLLRNGYNDNGNQTQGVYPFIDDNYENNNKIVIIWQEPYMNMKFTIKIYDIK